MTGNKFYEEVFARQIYNYKNVYDPSVGFMRGRKLMVVGRISMLSNGAVLIARGMLGITIGRFSMMSKG